MDVLGELRCVHLEALARVGYQHLGSHPETLPINQEAQAVVAASVR